MPSLTSGPDGPLQMLVNEVTHSRNHCAVELIHGFNQTSEVVRNKLADIIRALDPSAPGVALLESVVSTGKALSGPVRVEADLSSQAQVNSIFEKIDTNHDGVLDRAEYAAAYSSQAMPTCPSPPLQSEGVPLPVLGPNYHECRDVMRRQFDAAQGLLNGEVRPNVIYTSKNVGGGSVWNQPMLADKALISTAKSISLATASNPKAEALVARVTAQRQTAAQENMAVTPPKPDVNALLNHSTSKALELERRVRVLEEEKTQLKALNERSAAELLSMTQRESSAKKRTEEMQREVSFCLFLELSCRFDGKPNKKPLVRDPRNHIDCSECGHHPMQSIGIRSITNRYHDTNDPFASGGLSAPVRAEEHCEGVTRAREGPE